MSIVPTPAVRASFDSFADRGVGELTAFAGILLRSSGDLSVARTYADDPLVPSRVADFLKTAIGAGSTASEDFAALLPYKVANNSFLQSLRSIGVFDSAIEDMRRVPRRTKALSSLLIATDEAVQEGTYKPLASLSLSGGTLPEHKAACLLAMTSELAELVGDEGMRFFASELRRGVVAATDTVFVEALKNASTPIASAGATAEEIRTDLRAMITGVDLSAESRPRWIMPTKLATDLSLMQAAIGTEAQVFGPLGGSLFGFPANISDYVEDDEVLLFDAQKIAADPGIVLMDSTRHASLQMSDSPAEGAQSLVSLWQTNSKALRAERIFGFELLSSDAVSYLTGAQWGEV